MCYECTSNCLTCSDPFNCEVCYNGFYKNEYEQCMSCEEGCYNVN